MFWMQAFNLLTGSTRDTLAARVEVVSWPAAVSLLLRTG